MNKIANLANPGTNARTLRLDWPVRAGITDFLRWLGAHRGAVTMAGLLAFAAPVMFYAGDSSVMRDRTLETMILLALWWTLYGLEFWALLLLGGYVGQERLPISGRFTRGAIGLLFACAAAACASFSTAGRAAILVEHGVVQDAQTMHLVAVTFSTAMAVLFLIHLRRSCANEAAAARLAAAQTAQREARCRIVQGRLQAVQARIDPQLLFGMLDVVRQSYEVDPARAEQLLDELIAFLRAALPRLRAASSSVPREVELAHAYVRLHALAGSVGVHIEIVIAAEVNHARFPPGVLLPLLDDVLHTHKGRCSLVATRSGDCCQVVLTLPAPPTDAVLARVRALLAEVYGAAAELRIDSSSPTFDTTVKVPLELA